MLLFVVFVGCNSKEKMENEEHIHDKDIMYTCSMDPQIKTDKPGKCPICHMKLTPIKKMDSMANEISLSKQQIELGHIKTQFIVPSDGVLEQKYTGVLSINQDQIKTLSARTMGRIEKLYFKTIGENVRKNDPVYQLYSEDLAVAKQDYFTAYQQLSMPGNFGKNAKNMMAAAKQKLIFYGLSNDQIESIKKSKEVSPYTTFYSTVNGVISEIMATEGSYVMEGSGIIEVANLNTLWLETQVNVNSSASLRIGQTARISYTDFPGRSSSAKVSFINPEINPDTRLLLVRMEVPNPNLELKPGMQAIAQLKQSNIKGLFVPVDAVIQEQNASYIWVEKKEGVFENVMVTTGAEINGMIEIVSDLDPSKKVVITGAYGINSEYKFRKGSDPMEGHKM